MLKTIRNNAMYCLFFIAVLPDNGGWMPKCSKTPDLPAPTRPTRPEWPSMNSYSLWTSDPSLDGWIASEFNGGTYVLKYPLNTMPPIACTAPGYPKIELDRNSGVQFKIHHPQYPEIYFIFQFKTGYSYECSNIEVRKP